MLVCQIVIDANITNTLFTLLKNSKPYVSPRMASIKGALCLMASIRGALCLMGVSIGVLHQIGELQAGVKIQSATSPISHLYVRAISNSELLGELHTPRTSTLFH